MVLFIFGSIELFFIYKNLSNGYTYLLLVDFGFPKKVENLLTMTKLVNIFAKITINLVK